MARAIPLNYPSRCWDKPRSRRDNGIKSAHRQLHAIWASANDRVLSLCLHCGYQRLTDLAAAQLPVRQPLIASLPSS